jgi:hypothetical protein
LIGQWRGSQGLHFELAAIVCHHQAFEQFTLKFGLVGVLALVLLRVDATILLVSQSAFAN